MTKIYETETETLHIPIDFSKKEKCDTSEMKSVLEQMPLFELSYEIISHKKVLSPYNLAIAIPIGKKCLLWLTQKESDNVIYIIECMSNTKTVINKRFESVSIIRDIPQGICIVEKEGYSEEYNGQSGSPPGSLFYGVFVEDSFLIEDLFFYNGLTTKNMLFGRKLSCIYEFLTLTTYRNILLPTMWWYDEETSKSFINHSNYPIYSIQYRCLEQLLPFIYEELKKTLNSSLRVQNNVGTLCDNSESCPTILDVSYRNSGLIDFKKQQYKRTCVFIVKADIQFDIYNLFASKDHTNNLVFYDVAFIPDYKTSVFMNNIFRKIKENQNIDYIEESDDEDDFQNTEENKYIDINKTVKMVFVFYNKFKRWVPIQLIRETNNDIKVVNIMQL